MDREMFVTLYDYFTWARNLMIDAAAPLSAEQLNAGVPGVYGSIHDTLAHMAASEWLWQERIDGRSPLTMPAGSEFADLAAIRVWWDTAHTRSMAYLADLTPAELRR